MSRTQRKPLFSEVLKQETDTHHSVNPFSINDSQKNFFSFSPLVDSFIETLVQDNLPQTAPTPSPVSEQYSPPIQRESNLFKQVQEKFTSGNRHQMSDQEFLSFILLPHLGTPETEKTIKLIFHHWHNLSALLTAGIDEIKRKNILSDKALFLLEFMLFMPEFVLKRRILEKPVLASWTELSNYVRLKLGHLTHEEFHVWFLNHSFHLIGEECLSKGTINQAVIYPRNIVKMALERGAASVILIHNHPSGNTTPSGADIQVTQKIIKALAPVDIQVIDHLVVGDQQITSFRNLGLL